MGLICGFFGQFFNLANWESMAFPGFSFLCNSEFQQRWEFRNQEVDSSSDDAKSGSGIDSALKKHKLVPGLLPAEIDDPAQSPELQDGNANPEVGHGVITPNPKEVSRRRGKEKPVKKRKEISNRDVDREWRKRKSVGYDAALLDDLRKFRESLIEELSIERENLSGWMKDEMNKMAGNNGNSIGADRNKEANHVNNSPLLQNQCSRRPKKNAGDSKRNTGGPSARSSQRRKKAESASCLQAPANEKREMSETADKSKFPFLPLDHGLQLQQNSLSAGHRVPGSAAAMIEDRGESLELIGNRNHSSSQQLSQPAASNLLIMSAGENHLLQSPSFNFPLKITGKKADTDELSAYYRILLPEERSTYPNQLGPKNNTPSIQSISPGHLYCDPGRSFSNTITDLLPPENQLGDKGDVLGLQMNGGQLRFQGHGNSFI